MQELSLTALLTGVNSILIVLVGVLLKHQLSDIVARIVRIENLYFHKEEL